MRTDEDREPTQAGLILETLRARAGRWVAMPRLYRVSGAYAVHSRISELRGDGYRIECKVRGSRPRRSFYRLIA